MACNAKLKGDVYIKVKRGIKFINERRSQGNKLKKDKSSRWRNMWFRQIDINIWGSYSFLWSWQETISIKISIIASISGLTNCCDYY